MIFRRIAFFPNPWLLALLAVFAVNSGVAAETMLRAGAGPGLQDEGDSASQQNADERDARPELRLGEPSRSRDRDAMIPLLFTPRPNDPVGDIRAEVALPSGPWRFQRAEAPRRSEWKVSARQSRESDTTIELNVSSGSKPLPEGLIGYLRFRLDERESPLPSGLTIESMETEPPAIEVVAPRSPSSGFPGLSNDPSLSPTVTCFIFSH